MSIFKRVSIECDSARMYESICKFGSDWSKTRSATIEKKISKEDFYKHIYRSSGNIFDMLEPYRALANF
jgi:hypothetical protein